ncbi:hypothetical protein [Streptomyces sp. NPDC001530]|uniref:hypothetical protein n=1 Tax=Streptomyces sp. NPDC001530 TaxID=3364582 RepID=UPI0036B51519
MFQLARAHLDAVFGGWLTLGLGLGGRADDFAVDDTGPSASATAVGPAFALGDEGPGRANVYDHYRSAGPDGARARAAKLGGGADAVWAMVEAFEELGGDELMLNPTVDDLDQVARLADVAP